MVLRVPIAVVNPVPEGNVRYCVNLQDYLKGLFRWVTVTEVCS